MLPTTHFLYLALILFALGLGGAVLRRSLLAALLGVQLMFVAVGLLLATYAQVHHSLDGQVAAALVLLVGLLEVAVAVAVVSRARRGAAVEGGEDAGARLLQDWAAADDEELR